MLLNKLKSIWMKNTVNPYNRSEYIWSDRDMLKAAVFGGVIGAVVALVVYFQWFYKPPMILPFKYLVG